VSSLNDPTDEKLQSKFLVPATKVVFWVFYQRGHVAAQSLVSPLLIENAVHGLLNLNFKLFISPLFRSPLIHIRPILPLLLQPLTPTLLPPLI
jgi:hypothetical protein